MSIVQDVIECAKVEQLNSRQFLSWGKKIVGGCSTIQLGRVGR